MMNLVQKTVIIASVILATASGFSEEGADRSRELTLSDSVCGNFAVHGGSAITFADSAISGGDVGGCPGTSITGDYSLDEGELASTVASAQFVASAINAWQEMTAIRDDAMPILNPEIGGSTFTPGTWRSGTITTVAGTTVTLDGQGDRNSKFLFQAATTMNVGASCNIVLINKARVENVVWAVGTTFTSGANVDFKGSIMAGTAVTFGANTVFAGSILALTAVTLGAVNQVNGCIVALTAITFGAKNSVSAVPEAGPAAVIDFPSVANGNDEITIVCLPLIEDAPAACDVLSIDADMEAMLNKCTQKGISNAIIEARTGTRRASRSDIPHVEEGHIRMLPEGGRRARTSLRGSGQQEERGLGRRRTCHTTNPTFMTILLCCYNSDAYSFCGSPTNDKRRGLVETGGFFADAGITAAEVEQYLPSISLECSSEFKTLAEGYIGTNQNATCFAAASNVGHLKCYAIMVTGGDLEL